MKGGLVDKVQVDGDASIGHSRTDLNGTVHDDYVSAVVKDAEGRERQYLISQLDSLVMPNGRRVVFIGNQNGNVNVNGNENQNENQNQNGSRSLKRSSFSGRFPGVGTGNVTFKWTEFDRIRLDDGSISRATDLTADHTGATFVFDDVGFEAQEYTVYYPDRTVTIASRQTQSGADNTSHIGPSGDCGTATATPTSNTHHPSSTTYNFTLGHKAAYLCFLPHIDHLPSARVTQIDVSCSAPIAGTYELSASGLYNGTNTSKTISLVLDPNSQREHDFFLGSSIDAAQPQVASYMVIAPQSSSQTFTVTYHVTDTLSRLSMTYNQPLSNFQPVANTVYPITCNIPESLFRTVDMGYDYLWSSVNLGSELPNEAGTFYTHEATRAALNDSWLLPSAEAASELLDRCTWTWGMYNGTEGWFVEGTNNGNDDIALPRLFLPLNGYQDGGSLQQSTNGYYWLATNDGNPEGQDQALVIGHTANSRMTALMNSSLALNTRPVKALPDDYRIPVTGTKTVDLRTHGPGDCIKVYDSGGPNGNYEDNANGYMVIICAEGYKLNIGGTVDTEQHSPPCDPFEIYENGNMMAQWYCPGNVLNYTSQTNAVTLRLKSDGGTTHKGVDLTVTIQRQLTYYHVDIAEVTGGTMTANTYEANPEDTITLTTTPAAGYVLDHIRIATDGQVLTVYDDDPKMFGTDTNGSRHYQMCDTVCVHDGNWYHDTSFFLMPYGDVTVTPIFVKADSTLYVNMAAKDTTVIGRKYVQRLVDAGMSKFRLYDAGGKDADYKNNSDGYLLVEAPVGYIIQNKGSYRTESSYDYLHMYDGSNSSYYEWFNVSGGASSFNFTTNNNDMFMYFHSDGGLTYWGYESTVTFVPDTAMQYNIPAHGTKILTPWHTARIMEKAMSIKVYDHAGPNAAYSSSVSGQLLFMLPEGYHAHIYGTLRAETYHKESDPLGIYDGATRNGPCLFFAWDDYREVNVTTTSNVFLLYFKADGGTQGQGVDLTVDFIANE